MVHLEAKLIMSVNEFPSADTGQFTSDYLFNLVVTQKGSQITFYSCRKTNTEHNHTVTTFNHFTQAAI